VSLPALGKLTEFIVSSLIFLLTRVCTGLTSVFSGCFFSFSCRFCNPTTEAKKKDTMRVILNTALKFYLIIVIYADKNTAAAKNYCHNRVKDCHQLSRDCKNSFEVSIKCTRVPGPKEKVRSAQSWWLGCFGFQVWVRAYFIIHSVFSIS
jgi:hypothetical protein